MRARSLILVGLILLAAAVLLASCGGPEATTTSTSLAASTDASSSEQPGATLTTATASTAAEDAGQEIYRRVHASYSVNYDVDSLAALESNAIAAAQVRVLDTKQTSEQPKGKIGLGAKHQTTIVVEKVFKSDGRLREGSNYTIVEYYSTGPDPVVDGATAVWVIENSVPMDVGGEYIAFFQKPSLPELGDYDIYGVWRGLYKVTDNLKNATSVKDLSKGDIGAGYEYNGDFGYWKIAQEIKDKYIDGQ